MKTKGVELASLNGLADSAVDSTVERLRSKHRFEHRLSIQNPDICHVMTLRRDHGTFCFGLGQLAVLGVDLIHSASCIGHVLCIACMDITLFALDYGFMSLFC